MGRADTLGMDKVGVALRLPPPSPWRGVGVRNLGVGVGTRVGATLLLWVVVNPPVGVPQCTTTMGALELPPLPPSLVVVVLKAVAAGGRSAPRPAVTDTEGESKLGEEERLGRGEEEGADADGDKVGAGVLDTTCTPVELGEFEGVRVSPGDSV